MLLLIVNCTASPEPNQTGRSFFVIARAWQDGTMGVTKVVLKQILNRFRYILSR